MIQVDPLTIIGGHYGSGKTEVAVNLAYAAKRQGFPVTVADIDIVNPYFRSYEQKQQFEDAGIHIVTGLLAGTADLPSLPAEVSVLLSPDEETIRIIDLGGDPVGARILARYHEDLDGTDFAFAVVINANRPETASIAGCLRMIHQIETMSLQKVTHIINNTHLIDDTTVAEVIKGHELTREVAQAKGLTYAFTAALTSLIPDLETAIDVPLLPITRYMLKPWEQQQGESYAWLTE